MIHDISVEFLSRTLIHKYCCVLCFFYAKQARCSCSCAGLSLARCACSTVAYLVEVHVLRGGQAEALLAALVQQHALHQPVRHLHVAAVVTAGVARGVSQLRGRALHLGSLQQGRVTCQSVRLSAGREGGGLALFCADATHMWYALTYAQEA